jgi:hypothetical protein
MGEESRPWPPENYCREEDENVQKKSKTKDVSTQIKLKTSENTKGTIYIQKEAKSTL